MYILLITVTAVNRYTSHGFHKINTHLDLNKLCHNCEICLLKTIIILETRQPLILSKTTIVP